MKTPLHLLSPWQRGAEAAALAPGERAFCREWILRREEEWAIIASFTAVVFHVSFLYLDRFLGDRLLWLYRLEHLAALAVFFVWLLARRLTGHSLHQLTIPGHYVTVAGFALGLRYDLLYALERAATDVSWEYTLLSCIGCSAACFISLVAIPCHGLLLAATAVLYTAFGWAAWLAHPQGWKAALLHTGMMAGALLLKESIFARLFQEARIEHQLQVMRTSAERARADREHELLAQMRDALQPPAEVRCGDLSLRFLHPPNRKLRGGWMAARALPGDALAVVAVEPLGESIEAAMIGHAVYALWSAALAHRDLDPRAWLDRVDRTLARMGDSSQRTSVGLAVVDRRTITFWSAGNVPAFVAVGAGDQAEVYALTGGGPSLGGAPGKTRLRLALDVPPGRATDVVLVQPTGDARDLDAGAILAALRGVGAGDGKGPVLPASVAWLHLPADVRREAA